VLSVAILFPNTQIILQIASSSTIPLLAKLQFIGSLYGLLFSNFTVVAAVNTVVISILLGINITLLMYYIRRRQKGAVRKTGSGYGLAGAVAGLFGVGCAACGSVILTAFFTWFGLGGLLILLPLHGAEFGLLAILLLAFSIHRLCKRINDPLVCPIV